MAVNLKSMMKCTSKQNFAGTETTLYATCRCEVNGWPQTRAEVLGAAAAQGDTKILDAPFDFSLAPSGEGYWREIPIIVDTGMLEDVLEGTVGGQGYKSGLAFQIKGTGAEQLEFYDTLAAMSGNIIAMIRDKNKQLRVIGSTDVPASLSEGTSTTGTVNGDVNGGTFKLVAPVGITAPIYDDATHGIDVTPNP